MTGVCLILASRGRNELLIRTLYDTMRNAVRYDTEVVIVLDDDDPQQLDLKVIDADFFFWPRITVVTGPREDTLGAKYNRGYAQAPRAKLYVPFVDTVAIQTPGWDQKLYKAAKQFRDGIGSVYFGTQQNPMTLPQMVCLTRKFIELQGYFMPPYFSFWWHDTWTNEVSTLTRRVTYADIKLSKLPDDKKTRGARDIYFWATCYYELRHERYAAARKIINASDYPEWMKSSLNVDLEYWGMALNNREVDSTRNQKWCKQYELKHSFDSSDDARYRRVMAAMIDKFRVMPSVPKRVVEAVQGLDRQTNAA